MLDSYNRTTIESLEKEQSAYLRAELKAGFPLSIEGRNHEFRVETEILDVGSVSTKKLNLCLDLIDKNLGSKYACLHGPTWKKDKIKEMRDFGLIYILLYDHKTKSGLKLAGFLSMKIVVYGGFSVLYLYEIQLDEAYRNNGIGSQAMHFFSHIPDKLNLNRQYMSRFYPLDGTSLTVFSDNTGALRFYRAHGYKFSNLSPRDRRLKDKSVEKPSYYILIKYSSAARS